MRSISMLHPNENIPVAPDSVQTLLIAGSSGQAMDWPNSTSQQASSGVQIVRFTGVSTAGASLNFMVNLGSTHCAAPSSGSSVTTGTTQGSTWNNIPVMGQGVFQVSGVSTGWSVAALSSGYVTAELWKK